MKAMILAAGEGTRLHPLTYEFPKPLVPVVNRPVMERILAWLKDHRITDVLVNLHYLADHIENYFGDGLRFGVRIRYAREDQLWGTAGSVRRMMEEFDGTFLVIGGDDLSDVALDRIVEFHRARKALATLGLKQVEDTRQYGVVVIDDAGKIVRFQEKPKPEEALSRLANTGIYLFEPEIARLIPENIVVDFGKQVFPRMLERGEAFYGVEVAGYWCDIGTLHEYKESHWAALEGRCQILIHGRESPEGIWLEDGVSVDASAILIPPCALGAGTVVEAGARLSGYVVTGKNVRIETGAELHRAILWDGCRIGRQAVLKDCVMSQNAVVNPGGRVEANVVMASKHLEK